MITVDFANKTIRRPRGKHLLIKRHYNTPDIINEIILADRIAFKDVEVFAKNLKYKSLDDLCRQLFDFLLYNVRYKEDGGEFQAVKEPGALWATRFGDCKSFSLFIGSVMKSLNIPYTYRFASYRSNPVYTHVYPVVHGKNGSIIVDVVYKKYNQEKPYTHKKDYNMRGLYRIGTAGKSETMLDLRKPLDQMTEAELEAEIVRQRLAIEKDIVSGMRGVGSAKVQRYENALAVMGAFIGALESGDIEEAEAIADAVYDGNSEAISGIISGKIGVGKLKLFKKAKALVKKVNTKAGKLLKKTVQVAKKAGKAMLKIATLPQRLLLKGGLEVALPKAAPAFLYLFINDQKIIDKLPANMRKKRNMQVKAADFIVNIIGMKRAHFMGLVRNGIMKRYKKSPEAKVADVLKAKGISGIGGIGIIDDLLKAVTSLFNLLGKLFKKKAPVNAKEMVPDDSDTAGMTDAQASELAAEVKSQPAAVEPGESLNDEKGGALDESGRPSAGDGKKAFGIC